MIIKMSDKIIVIWKKTHTVTLGKSWELWHGRWITFPWQERDPCKKKRKKISSERLLWSGYDQTEQCPVLVCQVQNDNAEVQQVTLYSIYTENVSVFRKDQLAGDWWWLHANKRFSSHPHERLRGLTTPRWILLWGSRCGPSLWSWRPQRWGRLLLGALALAERSRSPPGSPGPPSAAHSYELSLLSESERELFYVNTKAINNQHERNAGVWEDGRR